MKGDKELKHSVNQRGCALGVLSFMQANGIRPTVTESELKQRKEAK